MIHIHTFRKHPRKLEIKNDGDISDGAFYRTSEGLLIIVYKGRRSVNEESDELKNMKKMFALYTEYLCKSIQAL